MRSVSAKGAVVGLANHTTLISRATESKPRSPTAARRSATTGRRARRRGPRLPRHHRAPRAGGSPSEAGRHRGLGELRHRRARTGTDVITDWNPGAEALFGFTAAEMIGRTLSSFAPPGDFSTPGSGCGRPRRRPRPPEFDVRRVTKDGRSSTSPSPCRPIRDEEGRVIGISRMIQRDVTERRRQPGS